MKTTGIIRRIDEVGRVVIPKEIRRTLDLHEGDPLEIIVEDDMICYKKYDSNSNYLDTVKRIKGKISDDEDVKNHKEIYDKLSEIIELLK